MVKVHRWATHWQSPLLGSAARRVDATMAAGRAQRADADEGRLKTRKYVTAVSDINKVWDI